MKNYAHYPCPSHTPWGGAQSRNLKAPGLWFVSTAGHGGMFMSPERAKNFQQLFPTFDGYAGLPWLEEDCDYCLGVLAFADEFTDEQVFNAADMVLNYKTSSAGGECYYFTEGRAWLLSTAGEPVRRRAEAYSKTREGLWSRRLQHHPAPDLAYVLVSRQRTRRNRNEGLRHRKLDDGCRNRRPSRDTGTTQAVAPRVQ